jgi:hypothetical protein
MNSSLLKPSEVFLQKIKPAFLDYVAHPGDERLANILATAINSHAEWTFRYYEQIDRSRLFGATTLKKFREMIFDMCSELRMMWDLADADKHRFLTRTGIERFVSLSTASYSVRDSELWVSGYEKGFLPAATAAVKFWEEWPD